MAIENKCVMALYDCRSKQEYIYRTNRIKEISGGSALLANVYSAFFERAAGNGVKINTDWQSGGIFSLEKFIEGGADGEVIYEGGGNLYMVYREHSTYIKANRIFSRMLLEETYSVSLVASWTKCEGDFIKERKALYDENSRQKATGNVFLPCNVLPITQVDGVTYMPIVEKKDGRSISAESKHKLKSAPKDEGSIYLNDDITPDKGTESLIAVIYADGNAMGKKVKKCTEGKFGYTECADELRKLSLRTNNSFVDRPIAAIEKMLAEKAEDGTHKYRKVIAGGDEITLICNARAAMDIAMTYFQTLEDENESQGENESQADKNYACMGIAIAHGHAPFSEVYKIAEQCCESGKKKARGQDSKVNYIDFHFCRSGITNDMDEIRESQEKEFTARPYEFASEFKRFTDLGTKLKKIGRSNVKELAAAIIKGDSYYRFEIERIKSRYDVSELDGSDEDQKRLIFDIANVFDLWFSDGEGTK